jgi:hypothetical protein
MEVANIRKAARTIVRSRRTHWTQPGIFYKKGRNLTASRRVRRMRAPYLFFCWHKSFLGPIAITARKSGSFIRFRWPSCAAQAGLFAGMGISSRCIAGYLSSDYKWSQRG